MATKRYTPKEFIQPVAKRWKKLKKTPLKLGKPRDFQSPAAELRRLIGELQTGDLASFREMWKVYFYRELHRPLRSLLALRGCLGTVDVVSAPGFNEDSKFVRDPPPPPLLHLFLLRPLHLSRKNIFQNSHRLTLREASMISLTNSCSSIISRSRAPLGWHSYALVQTKGLICQQGTSAENPPMANCAIQKCVNKGRWELLCKIVLILVNIIFMNVGLYYVLYVQNKFIPLDLQDKIAEFLNATTNTVNATLLAQQTTDELYNLDLHKLVLVLTIFMCFMCYFGYIGPIFNSVTLIIYVTMVSAVMITQAVTTGLFATGKLDQLLKTRLTDALVGNYKGNFDLGIESLSMNTVQGYYGCCGVNGWMDFLNATHWNRAEGFKVGNFFHEVASVVPYTCCRFVGKFPVDFSLVDERCPETPTSNNSFIFEGCYDKIREELLEGRTVVLWILEGSLVLEFVCVLAGIYVFRAVRKRKSSENDS
ncbi:hypothetical protein CAPTEDRAFT_211131 [Capitella teleta]|uniref:Tetraspanin n=1 Tax=Capitella teleta TaxID=283909 RepID=R7TLV9_CAPTE|nr:hypothetical protein CAPTEDRAFT_211131 [Capitella teleta]|eukprot:ELT94507.1 hypothetical protein CAPTEDRAFT_211131 [Capitella teleta]